VGLGGASQREQEVALDPVVVVLGLRVDHAEHCVGVGAAVHVGQAPVVAGDGDRARVAFAAFTVGIGVGVGSGVGALLRRGGDHRHCTGNECGQRQQA